MRQKTFLLLLLCSTALFGQIPAPTVNTTLFGREGNNLIPVSVAQILGLSTGLSTVAVNSTLTGNGTAGSPLRLAQQGAVAGSTYRNTGTSWVPSNTLFNTGTQVGVNTTTPSESLSVVGGIEVSRNSSDYTNAGGANSHIIIRNPNISGQNVISSYIQDNLVAKWRTDYDGNVNWIANAGYHAFYTGGDVPTGTVKMWIYNSGLISLPQYGSGTITGTPARFLAVQAGGNIIERTSQEMSQDAGNWGQLYQWPTTSTMDDANAPYGFSGIGGVGINNYYRLKAALGRELGTAYEMELIIEAGTENPFYIRGRRKYGAGWGLIEKLASGYADVAGQLSQLGTAGQVLRNTGGTSWAASSGFTLSATGVPTSTGLAGTGDRLPILDASGTLIRSALDPNILFQRNAAYTANTVGDITNLKWDGTNWSAGRENGNWGRKDAFGSFTSFELAAAAGKEGACYVYNPAGGGTAITDQPMPSGIHGYYCITIGIGSDIATTAHCMQIAYGQPATVIADREWRRYRINGNWQSWIDVSTPRQNGAILGDVLKWTGAAFTPEKDAAAYESTNATIYNVANNNVRHIIADAQFNNVDIRFNGDEPDGATWRIYCRGTAANRFVFVTVSSPLTTIRRANNFQTNSGVTSQFNSNVLVEATKIGNILYINTVSN